MRGGWNVEPQGGDTSGRPRRRRDDLARARVLRVTSGTWHEVAGDRRVSRAAGHPTFGAGMREQAGSGRGRPSVLRVIEARTWHGAGLLARVRSRTGDWWRHQAAGALA
jgi:hypothetical protein